jgi:hypothetical protein
MAGEIPESHYSFFIARRMHNEVIHDVLFIRILDRLFHKGVQQFLKIIRIHIPQICQPGKFSSWLFFRLIVFRVFLIPVSALFLFFIKGRGRLIGCLETL